MGDECSKTSVMRKPDAGNLHGRFEEGEGTRRSLALPLIPCVPLYSTLEFCALRKLNSESFREQAEGNEGFRRRVRRSILCFLRSLLFKICAGSGQRNYRRKRRERRFPFSVSDLLFASD